MNTMNTLVLKPEMLASSAADSEAADVHEVWGDTVKLRNLTLALVLSLAISLAFYFGGRALLGLWISDLPVLRAYAMLVGIGGCLVAGSVCALLFKPQRNVVEEVVDEAARDKVMAQLASEPGGLGELDKLPPYVQAEMKELGLYELFRKYEDRIAAGEFDPSQKNPLQAGAK